MIDSPTVTIHCELCQRIHKLPLEQATQVPLPDGRILWLPDPEPFRRLGWAVESDGGTYCPRHAKETMMNYDWLRPTLTAMGELLKLEENWDSYEAARISPLCVKAALDFMDDAMQNETPTPAVVPTHEGGIQCEWHINCHDLEIEFRPSGKVTCLYYTEDVAESFDDDDVKNLAALHPLVRKLAQPTKGASDAPEND